MPGSSGEGSFAAVVLPHLDAAYNLARWLMRDATAAEDVVQEAMLRALTYFSSFKGVNPRAWLLQIVRNTAYASQSLDRGVQFVPIVETAEPGTIAAEDLVSGADDPEAALIRARGERQVRELIAALPVELREPLVLRELEELSYKEIAEITGTPIGTVMSRLFRARRLLMQAAGAGGASSIAAPECDKVLLVQAELDGELDAAEAAALAVHRATCPICQAAAAELTQARALIGGGLYHAMPDDLRGRVITRVVAARPSVLNSPRASPVAMGQRRPWWSSPIGFGLALSAAALLFFTFLPRELDIPDQIVAGHIRALQPGHLEDVASSDQHTVKPWFDGRIDFAPPVKDLAAERFPLRGGRLDYVAGRPVAALVYQHDKHLIDLYVWPAAGAAQPPETATRQGYNVVHWTQNGMALWAVSDLEAGQLRAFAEDWRLAP